MLIGIGVCCRSNEQIEGEKRREETRIRRICVGDDIVYRWYASYICGGLVLIFTISKYAVD